MFDVNNNKGLPGFVLTKADSFASKKGGGGGSGGGIVANNNYGGTRTIENNSYNNNESFIPPSPLLPPIGLKVMGPIGTKQFFQAIRHFVRRDHFRIQVIENSDNDKDTKNTPQKRKRDDTNTIIIPTTNATSSNNSINNNNQPKKSKQLLQNEKKDKKTQKVQESMDYFRIQPLRFTRFINVPIMCRRRHDDHDDDDDTAQFLNSPNPNPNSISTNSNSIEKHDITTYIFRTPSIPRRFVLAKAKALGVNLFTYKKK